MNKGISMANLSDIYDELYEINTNDTLAYIKLYENNQFVLDNKSKFNDRDDFDDYLNCLFYYIVNLEYTGRYKKAIKYSDIALKLIEAKKDEYDIEIDNFTAYWSILTTKGRSLNNLKDYDNSIEVFKKILEWDNENDNIREWLNDSRSKKRNSINKYLYIIGFSFFFLEALYVKLIDGPKPQIHLLEFGYALFFIGLMNEYYGDKVVNFLKRIKW